MRRAILLGLAMAAVALTVPLQKLSAQEAAAGAAPAAGAITATPPAAGEPAAAPAHGGGHSGGLIAVILRSGWFGVLIWVLLLACLVIAVALIADSYISISEKKISPSHVVENVRAAIEQGDLLKAMDFCKHNPVPLSRILIAGFSNVEEGFEVVQDAVGVAADIESERMLSRVRKLDKKACRQNLGNIRVLRLEAFYTFYYLLPRHRVRTVYVFFPDPWPKRRHSSRRLFSPLFLDALWARLEVGGVVQVATDHPDYYAEIHKRLSVDPRFKEVPAMERTAAEQTEFEQIFRGQGLAIGQCAFQSLPGEEAALPPLEIPPEMEPKDEREAAEWEAEERLARSEPEVELP